jgi:uncharacterized protein YeaO (DUF488 family)
MAAKRVGIARAYEERKPDDGTRILVDRLWPRGLRKDEAQIDEWLKAIAPSTGLRKWYAHEPERFEEFKVRYRDELEDAERAAALDRLRDLAKKGDVTLLTSTHDPAQSHLPLLAALLR